MNVQIEAQTQFAAQAEQRGRPGVVLAHFEPGDGWLRHPEPAGESRLGELVLRAIPDQAIGYRTSECRAFPVLPELRILELRLEDLIKTT